jgi:PAS domain S-box-containing protein/putative nucleotidyltransferase with HDIG domain
MEKYIIKSEDYRTIFETTSSVILIINQNGTLSAVNNFAKEMLGVTETYMNIPYKWLDFIAKKDRTIVLYSHKIMLGSGELKFNKVVQKYVVQFIDKNGDIRDMCLNLAIVPGTKDTVISAIDVTQIKQSEKKLKESNEKLHDLLESTISALCGALKQKDSYTAEHQRKVAALACAIAKEMNLSKEQIKGIKVAGLLHDIGKISIPMDILNKPGRLSNNEFNLVKEHAEAGKDIVKPIDFPWPVATIILQHHERINGSGYPNRLKGDELLLESKVIAVADTVDAMLSHRPYRPALGIQEAINEISQQKGTLYDSSVVNASLRVLSSMEFPENITA